MNYSITFFKELILKIKPKKIQIKENEVFDNFVKSEKIEQQPKEKIVEEVHEKIIEKENDVSTNEELDIQKMNQI